VLLLTKTHRQVSVSLKQEAVTWRSSHHSCFDCDRQ